MKFMLPRSLFAMVLTCALSLPALAGNHDVAAGGALPPTSDLATSDTITLTGNPASLTAQYDLGAKSITIRSDAPSVWRTLSYGGASGNNARILTMTGGGTWTFDNIIFSGGKPTGSGGAISITGGSGTTTINGSFVVRDNVSTSDGGGLYFTGAPLAFTGPVLFQSNTTSATSGNVAGGAIYAGANLSIAGSSTFAYNTSLRPVGNTAGGGAIFVFGNNTLSLDASAGDITFIGNTTGGVRNAIHIRSQSNGGTLTLDTGTGAGAHTIYFYDPITSMANLVPVIQNGDGTVVYDTYSSAIAANASINSGTMKLTKGAAFGYSNSTGAFKLGPAATLSGNGAILSSTITLTAGSTLEVLGGGTLTLNSTTRAYSAGLNLGGYGTIDAKGPLSASRVTVGTLTHDSPDASTAPATRATGQTLALAPGTTLNIDNGGTLNFSIFGAGNNDLLAANTLTLSGSAYINIIGSAPGSYKIITAANDISAYQSNFITRVNGIDPTGRYGAALSFQNSGLDAYVALSSTNIATTWNGTDTATWKNSGQADANWASASVADTHFINGDSVSFTDSATVKNITIDTASVIVADMTVNNTAGSDYRFDGDGGITASTANSTGLTGTGRLVKQGAGALNFANGANTFSGGITVSGGTLGFTNGNQLGDAGNGIAITGNATLRANANALTLANNIAIAPSITATIDTGANTLTHTGVLTGNNTATLAKTGAGTLNLAGNYTGYNAITNLQEGALNLASGVTLAGTINIAGGATLSGNGSAGNVISALGGILEIGSSPIVSGTLIIGSLTLDSSVLRFDLFASNTSDRLIVTNLTIVGSVGTNTIDVNSGVTGTFNLGNIAALNGAQVTIDGMAQAANSRSVATTSTNNGNLILTAGADISRIMYWTGSNNALWNNANWSDGGDKDLFANGDRVIFNSLADTSNVSNRAITVQAAGVIASDMHVLGAGNYAFTGGGIVTDGASVVSGAGAIATGDGKLTKTDNGSLAFENAANNFIGGIDHGGGVITFTNGNQLIAGGAGITFAGSATLRPAADAALATNIRINAGVTGVIDADEHTLIYTGTLTAGDATATLSKTGGSILGLDSDNSAYAGRVSVDEGMFLLLSSTARLGGTTTVNAGAIFGGIGSAATVNALTSSTILATAGVLDIAALTLNDGSALAGTGTLLGNATFLGDITADIDTGHALTFAGTAAGAGTLAKTGEGTFVYSGNASLGHAGATVIGKGIVGLENIANTDTLAHTFTIDGGWLALSSTGTLNEATASNWTALTIDTGSTGGGGVMGSNDRLTFNTGGTIAYNIGGSTAARQGIFVVIDAHDDTVTFTGTNNTYRGYTRIDSGTLSLTGNNQLGASSGTVALNGGVLQLAGSGIAVPQTIELRTDSTIDIHFTGSVGKSISGPITKTGVTPVTLIIANSNYVSTTGTSTAYQTSSLLIANSNAADALHVNSYINVTARHIAAAGQGAATIDRYSAFTYQGVSGTLANNFTGKGTLGIANASAITLTGANDIAYINISGTSASAPSTVVAASPNALGSFDTVITGSNVRITLAAPVNNIGALALYGDSLIGFRDTGGYKQANVTTLSGNGTLAFNTDIAHGAGDHMTIAYNALGSYTIVVNDTGAQPADPSAKLDLINASGGSATFTLAGAQDYVDAGIYAYTLDTSAAAGGLSVSLVNAPGQYSTAANIIKSMAGAMPMNWFSELESVTNRMGEVRLNDTATSKNFTTWVRGYARRFNVNDKPAGLAFDEKQYGADAGADFKALDAASNIFLGAFVGYGQADRDFAAAGTGRSESAYVGAYVTISNPAGWYLDAIVKGNKFKNRIDAVDTSGNPVTARYTNNGAGASLEGGKYITLAGGWFAEPQVQGQYATISAQDYTTSNNIKAAVDRATSAQARGGLLFGRLLVNSEHDRLQAYIKAHGAYQWVTGGKIHANGLYIGNPKIEGARFEAGAGLAWTIAQVTQLYFDYQYAHSSDYTKPFSVNLGIRHSW